MTDVLIEAQRGDPDAIAHVERYTDWHTIRRTGVGGSDVPAILGLDKYRRPIDVYQDKISWPDGDPSVAPSEPARWGKILEAPIADEFQRRHGGPSECYLDGPYPTGRHPSRHWHLFTVDRLVLNRSRIAGLDLPSRDLIVSLLEIKARGWRAKSSYGDEGSDAVPFPEMCQVLWYLSGLDIELATIAVLFNTWDYREFQLARDVEAEAEILGKVEHFWTQHVLKREPPPPDGSEQYGRWLAKRHDKTTAGLLEPSDDAREAIHRLRAIKRLQRTIAKDRSLAEQLIANEIGDKMGLDLGDGTQILYKHHARGKVNHSAVAEELANRLEIGPRALKAIQDKHRGRAPRVMYTPRRWLDDETEQ